MRHARLRSVHWRVAKARLSGASESAQSNAMSEFDKTDSRKWLGRAAVLAACVIVVSLAVSRLGAGSLFVVAGAVIVLVYVFDAPQLVFSALDAARRKIRGVEHDGRHDWYGFRGTTMRLFFDDAGLPWIAVKEIALVLRIDDVAQALRHYGPAEFAAQSLANGEQCLSEIGLQRLLKHSRHRDAHALLLWFEREVMLPLRRRRESFPGAAGRN